MRQDPHARGPDWYTGRMDAPVTIVGAGPAGLALARELRRLGVRPVLLERGRVGETWARQYQGLRLHSLARASALPGLPWRDAADGFPDAAEMVRYLRSYAERCALDVREGVTLRSAEPAERPRHWRLDTDGGAWRTPALVMATGIWSAPLEPELPGREHFAGRVLHVSAYRGPGQLTGARVLVVGLGNSGKDVVLAAAGSALSATVAVRSGAAFVDYPNALTQRSGELWRRLPPRLGSGLLRLVRRQYPELGLPWPDGPLAEAYPVVGLELIDAVRAGRVRVRPATSAFTRDGARFVDGTEDAFDLIVLCTGYRPALDPVAAQLEWGPDGRPRTDESGVRALGAPGLYLFGYRYPTLETYLQRLRREAPRAARVVSAGAR